jgi:hypothetical protein
MHYQRQRKHGDENVVKSKSDSYPDICTVADCSEKYWANGLCNSHGKRKYLREKVAIGEYIPPHNKLSREEAARNHWETRYKVDARRRGFEWALLPIQFDTLIFAPCNYCGHPPEYLVARKDRPVGPLYVSGIDRVDSMQGYIWGNVVPCCNICNRAKNNMPVTEFFEWINRLIAHQRPT